jgi:RimJ/RimL family protein N-acetyltransferase
MISHPTQLSNSHVLLRPLELNDLDELLPLAQDTEIWTFFRGGQLTEQSKLKKWVEEALDLREKGIDYPFVTIDRASGRVAGSTRFRLLDPRNRSLEIGGSWLGKDFRGTGLNRHAKYLMLEYAFEALRTIRVQFRTDDRNKRSQRAVERIGALREGAFRKDYIYADGFQRTSIFYSITDDDWPRVRGLLRGHE